jgi:hypothetical protein
VGSTALCVHVSLPNHSVSLSSSHQLEALVCVIDNHLVYSLHIDTVLLAFVDKKLLISSSLWIILE